MGSNRSARQLFVTHVYMHVCVYVRMCVCVYVCMRVCVCILVAAESVFG